MSTGALIAMWNNLSFHDGQKEEWATLGQSAFAEHFLNTKENFKKGKTRSNV